MSDERSYASRMQEAEAYVRRIKNQNKHRYAIAVLVELANGRDGSEAEIDGDLSFMARQAVQMRLSEIMVPKEGRAE